MNGLETDLTSPVSVPESAAPGGIAGVTAQSGVESAAPGSIAGALHSLGGVGCLPPFT